MWKIFSAALFVAALAPIQTSSTVDVPVLHMSELHENLNNSGSSVRDCLVVFESGRFHLERRVQQSPKPTADLSVFETQLSPEQAGTLKKIVSADEVLRLPAYTPPAFPLSISTFDSLIVTIRLNGLEQTAGYLEWPNKNKSGSPNNTLEQVQQDWRLSEGNLEPLRSWVRDLEKGALRPTQFDPTLCISLS